MNSIEIENPQQIPLFAELETVVERVAATKGWAELYKKIRTQERLPPIIAYKMIYKANGDEQKIQEKITERKTKLQKKLKKNNLETQFEELSKIVQICHPKMALRVLKHNGGNVALAAQKIQAFSSIGSHKHGIMEIFKTQYPNYLTIIEELLSSGFIFPIPFFLRLMQTYQGDITKMKEYLGQQDSKCWKKIMKHQFKKGRCMMMEGFDNKFKKFFGKFKRSHSASSSSESESELDDDKLNQYAKANQVLIENGFQNAKKNLRVLKENKCDTEAALNQLIKETLKKGDKKHKKGGHHGRKHHHRSPSSSSGSEEQCYKGSRSRHRSCKKDNSESSSSSSSDRSHSKSNSHSSHREKHHRHGHHGHHGHGHHGHGHHGHGHHGHGHHHQHPHHFPHHFPPHHFPHHQPPPYPFYPHDMSEFEGFQECKKKDKKKHCSSKSKDHSNMPPPPPPFHHGPFPYPPHHHPYHGQGHHQADQPRYGHHQPGHGHHQPGQDHHQPGFGFGFPHHPHGFQGMFGQMREIGEQFLQNLASSLSTAQSTTHSKNSQQQEQQQQQQPNQSSQSPQSNNSDDVELLIEDTKSKLNISEKKKD